jgi:hypothetical protein
MGPLVRRLLPGVVNDPVATGGLFVSVERSTSTGSPTSYFGQDSNLRIRCVGPTLKPSQLPKHGLTDRGRTGDDRDTICHDSTSLRPTRFLLHFALCLNMVVTVGIEPTTPAFSERYSSN